MKNILIVGGAGFIGSNVCRELIKKGYKPIVLDGFISYISPLKSAYQKYLQFRFNKIEDKVEIIRGDARDKDDLRRVIMKYKPSRIIHLAALPIADLSNEYSEEALSSILQASVNVLEIIRDVKFVKRFVYASSSMIYGDFQYFPADEDHPKKPKELYGATKYAGEIMIEAFARRFNINYTIVRPSAVYGPTDVNRRVSQIFVENAILNKPIYLQGGGETKLDFTYITDIARGFVLATLSVKAKNEIFNITSGQGRSLKEFVDILKEYYPNLKIHNKPANIFHPCRGSLSIAKAKRLLGYAPKYTLEKGIKEYINFLKDKL
jgi:nucleoside-diphosphate-sugar epimerase